VFFVSFVVTMPRVEVPPPEPRNLALDGARGLAIVLILLCHGLNYPMPDTAASAFVQRLCTFTFGGVELFFVLSGFLIGTGLLRTRAALNQPAVFYLRRACRILPVYALLLASFFLLRDNATLNAASAGEYFRLDLPLWSYFVFLQNNAMGALHRIGPWWLVITWSLAIEEQFYAVVPWMMRRISPATLGGLALTLVVACPILRYVLLFQLHNPAGAVYLTAVRIDSLVVGLAVAALWENPVRQARLVARRRSLGWAVLAFVLLFVAGPFTPLGSPNSVIVWMPTLLGLGFAALLLWILAAPDHAVARGLRTRFWVLMGGLSYFVYLFHFPALYTSHALLRHAAPAYFDGLGVAATFLAFSAVVLAALASRRWLELPFIRLGHRFQYRFS
jgi:peptidoglycan/LPS O-acetylase OafA/YrhL